MLESEHASLSSSQAAASSNATQNNANSQLSGSNGNGASLSAPMTSHGMINATNSSSNQTLHSSSINTSSSGSRGLNPLLSNHFSHQNTNSSNNGISGGNGSTTKHCNAPSVAPAIFNRYSMRCGRILDIPNNDYCWRWTGFNYGVDLLMLFSNNQLMIKRNVNTHPTTQRCVYCSALNVFGKKRDVKSCRFTANVNRFVRRCQNLEIFVHISMHCSLKLLRYSVLMNDFMQLG